MNETELDQAYGDLCRLLSAQGEARALPILARFALLAIHEIGDARQVRELIAAAGRITPP